jgi:hypothetical protein
LAINTGCNPNGLRSPLARTSPRNHVAALGTTNLMEELDKIRGEWRSWIGGHPQQARQILGKLVVGRLTFTPKVEAGTAFYEFTGTGALQPILAGVLPPGNRSGSDRVKQWCPRGETTASHGLTTPLVGPVPARWAA